jgi:phage/plasmid-like protein (TIGR03299 family)
MSHDLDFSTGDAALAYVGELPWHGLGQRLEEGAPIEEWVKAARLDWGIQMLPVQYSFGGQIRCMPERFVLARSDTGQALSVVSSEYHVVQPKAILEFYRDLVGERGYVLETAGALDNGRKVWALARTGLVSNVANNERDNIGAYVLLATSCDKSIATTATFTSIRVVCQNTLGFAFDDQKRNNRRNIKTDHTKIFNPTSIKEQLGLIDEAWRQFLNKINQMTTYPLIDQMAFDYFVSIFQSDKDIKEGKALSAAKCKELGQISSLFTSAQGQDIETTKGTLWGAVNAVTYYVDHVRSITQGNDRIDSAWFGSGALLKDKAWERAVGLLSTVHP